MTGQYDIVIDINNNGYYDEGVDALDNSDIEVTAGVIVIPEFSSTVILSLILVLTLLAGMVSRMKFKPLTNYV